MRLLDKQKRSLLDKQRRRFERELYDRLQPIYPPLFERLPRAAVERAIHMGVERGLGLSLSAYRHLSLIVSLCFLLGHRFLDDPLYPWAREVMLIRSDSQPRYRVEILRQLARDFIQRAEGPRNEHINAALARLAAEPFEQALPVPDNNGVGSREAMGGEAAVSYAAERLHYLHPHKYAALGESRFMAWLRQACAAAEARGLGSPRGCTLYSGMWLMMGMGFEDDPLQPWAEACLSRVRRAPAERRAALLHAAIVRHVAMERTS